MHFALLVKDMAYRAAFQEMFAGINKWKFKYIVDDKLDRITR